MGSGYADYLVLIPSGHAELIYVIDDVVSLPIYINANLREHSTSLFTNLR